MLRHTQLFSIILDKLGYSRIKIDHIADSLLKLQIKIEVHLISVELSQLFTLGALNTVITRLLLSNSFIINFRQKFAKKKKCAYLIEIERVDTCYPFTQ